MGCAVANGGDAIFQRSLRPQGSKVGNLGLESADVFRRGVNNEPIKGLDPVPIPGKTRWKALGVRIQPHAE